MTNNVVIALSCGTNNPNRATRAFHLATVAHKEGKKVTVFLLDEAVYLARVGLADNLRAATGDIAESELIEGARFGAASELIHLACDGAVISL
jgi:hypothetical protein